MRSQRYHCMTSLLAMLFGVAACAAQGQSPQGGFSQRRPHQAQRLPPVQWDNWQPSSYRDSNTHYRDSNAHYREDNTQYRGANTHYRDGDARLADRYFADSTFDFNPHKELPSGPAIDVMPPPDFANYSAGYVPFDDSLGPSIRVFEPKARVYFDTGWEAPDKLDIFHDGSIAPSINFLEIYWAKQWAEGLGHPDWRWGPNIGVGISSPADGSRDGSIEASGAPVLMVSYGLLFEFPLSTRQIDALREDPAYGPAAANRLRRLAPKAGIEFGYALGVSSDETLDFSADGAIYVGITVHAGP